MRLIDADELLKDKVSNAYISRFEIENAPTIDAEPVVHGHWINGHDTEHLMSTCKCSTCGRGIVQDFLGRWKYTRYCPNCGAKMDEVQDD